MAAFTLQPWIFHYYLRQHWSTCWEEAHLWLPTMDKQGRGRKVRVLFDSVNGVIEHSARDIPLNPPCLSPRGLKWCFRDSDCFPHIRPSITADTPRQRTIGWRWFKFNCRKFLEEGFSFKYMVNKNKNKSIHQRAACSQGQSGRLGWWLNWQGW